MSEVDYGRLRSLTLRELTQALLSDGFVFTRQRGSHRRYALEDGRRVTVPSGRTGATLAPATLRSIIGSQARWTARDLRRFGLIS
ncbi:MAG: hypothetical protein BZY75_00785 [SAR202 cluster bacterium Io17-Chloro-G7]|nr:MAG: hypothetical protein BZY75_00785 [SAR202 cluster bacterium Io17-Chloro-G7]